MKLKRMYDEQGVLGFEELARITDAGFAETVQSYSKYHFFNLEENNDGVTVYLFRQIDEVDASLVICQYRTADRSYSTMTMSRWEFDLARDAFESC